MKGNNISRRTFMQGTASVVSLAGLSACSLPTLPWNKVPQPRVLKKGEKLRVACVGAGGQGNSQVSGMSGENIVALCDVDEKRAAGSFKKHPNAKKYKDYRKMLCEMRDEIDAVTVSTPDHSHFGPALMAIQMGKHVYVQKPLTHTVWEARELRLQAEKYGVQTVMGNQGHCNEGSRLMVEWVRGGLIGDVREVYIYTNRPVWPQGTNKACTEVFPNGFDKAPIKAQKVRDGLDWNLWLGVAPKRPYHSVYSPFNWRGWWDYGCGALGDMACHTLDAAYWSLDLGAPVSVEAKSSPLNPQTCPDWSIVTYKFAARPHPDDPTKTMPPVTLKWYDGTLPNGKQNLPPRPKGLEPTRRFRGSGQIIIGTTGTLYDTSDYCNSPRLIPEAAMKDAQKKKLLPPKTLRRIEGTHPHGEWIRAIKGENDGLPCGSNFNYAGPLTEAILLGNVAIKMPGKKLEWDAENLCFPNCPKANKLLTKHYRDF